MLPSSRSCTAVCWREGSSWVVSVPELGRSAPAARLSQVERVARDLVTSADDEHPDSPRVVVDLRVRHSVTELMSAAAALRAQPDRVSVEAVTLRRCLARRLVAEGFDVRDVAALLGLSYGRTLQLVGEQHAAARTGRLVRPARDSQIGARAFGEAALRPVAAERSSTSAEDVQEEMSVVKPHSSYRHEAFLYRGPQEFLTATVAFVEEAVALGQPVMVVLVPERLELLRAALPPDAPVFWVDMEEIGANPARIIPAWRAFIDEHGGRGKPVRGVGEPIWATRRPAELVECQLHEALLNLAVEPDTPLWLRCPYDVEALSPAVVEEASRSHPALVDASDYRGSLLYGGVDHVAAVFSAALPPPAQPVEDLAFDAGTVGDVRPVVLAHAAAAGLTASRAADVALAVTEAATNSVRHGGGRGALRVWEQDGALLCEVRDTGRIEDPLVGRRMPSLEGDSGRGLWLANQLADLVQVRSGSSGTAVRVLSWLETPAA